MRRRTSRTSTRSKTPPSQWTRSGKEFGDRQEAYKGNIPYIRKDTKFAKKDEK